MGNEMFHWTDENRSYAREQRGQISAAQIARNLGGCCTRNAVIGLWNRMGLEKLRPSGPRVKSNLLRLPRKAKPAEAIMLYEPEPLKLNLLKLKDDQCRFPVTTEGGQYTFCGHPVMRSKTAYCPYHHEVCWEKHAAKPRQYFRFPGRAA